MTKFIPYITADGSVGLYNSNVKDIYHSATGALSEALDKFVNPVDFDMLISKDNIKVLDICYGIGYNSKAFLNFITENYLKKSSQKFIEKFLTTIDNIAPIHTNKIGTNQAKLLSVSNEAIYTNNIFKSISITTLDTDEILMAISPFIKTGIKNPKKYNNGVDIGKDYGKYYIKAVDDMPKISKIINYFIFVNVLKAFPNLYSSQQVLEVLNNKFYSNIFDKHIIGIFNHLTNFARDNGPKSAFLSSLHNIYYRYLSKRYKKALNCFKSNNVSFKPVISDARYYIKNDNNVYNLIFLDAFSPNKCPCLWTYDFFKCLYERLDDDGMLLTYSTSAPVRNAMVQAGFFIGNNIKNNKSIGTICVKNKRLIKHPLSEFEIGLLNTRAGIFYRDENLTAQNKAIIEARNLDVNNSDKISTTQYIKSFKNVK